MRSRDPRSGKGRFEVGKPFRLGIRDRFLFTPRCPFCSTRGLRQRTPSPPLKSSETFFRYLFAFIDKLCMPRGIKKENKFLLVFLSDQTEESLYEGRARETFPAKRPSPKQRRTHDQRAHYALRRFDWLRGVQGRKKGPYKGQNRPRSSSPFAPGGPGLHFVVLAEVPVSEHPGTLPLGPRRVGRSGSGVESPAPSPRRPETEGERGWGAGKPWRKRLVGTSLALGEGPGGISDL